MDFFQASRISAAGMSAQKARVEAAAMNLSNMHAAIEPGTAGYQPVTALLKLGDAPFSRAWGTDQSLALVQAQVAPLKVGPPRTTYDPGHPYANASGMVSYPAIDHTREMLTVVSALRAYESNLTVLQISRTMASKALDIGGAS